MHCRGPIQFCTHHQPSNKMNRTNVIKSYSVKSYCFLFRSLLSCLSCLKMNSPRKKHKFSCERKVESSLGRRKRKRALVHHHTMSNRVFVAHFDAVENTPELPYNEHWRPPNSILPYPHANMLVPQKWFLEQPKPAPIKILLGACHRSL